jgi:hypothetical protein
MYRWLVALAPLIGACGSASPAPAVPAAPPTASVAVAAERPAAAAAAPVPRDAMRVAYGSNTGIQGPFAATVGEGFLARQGIDAQIDQVAETDLQQTADRAGQPKIYPFEWPVGIEQARQASSAHHTDVARHPPAKLRRRHRVVGKQD